MSKAREEHNRGPANPQLTSEYNLWEQHWVRYCIRFFSSCNGVNQPQLGRKHVLIARIIYLLRKWHKIRSQLQGKLLRIYLLRKWHKIRSQLQAHACKLRQGLDRMILLALIINVWRENGRWDVCLVFIDLSFTTPCTWTLVLTWKY